MQRAIQESESAARTQLLRQLFDDGGMISGAIVGAETLQRYITPNEPGVRHVYSLVRLDLEEFEAYLEESGESPDLLDRVRALRKRR